MINRIKICDKIEYLHYITEDKKDKAVLMLAVNIGSLQDGIYKGIAHFLEHMLMCDIPICSQQEGIHIMGTTNFCYTVFEMDCPNNLDSIDKCINILIDILSGKYLNIENMEVVRKDICNEISIFEHSNNTARKVFMSLIKGSLLQDTLPVGRIDAINNICFEDITRFYSTYYLSANVLISSITNINSDTIRNTIINKISNSNIKHKPTQRDSIINNMRMPFIKTIQNHNESIVLIMKCVCADNEFTLQRRIIEDLTFLVLENYWPRFSSIISGVEINRIRYAKNYQFIKINIYSDHEVVKSTSKDWYIYLQLLNKYIHDNLTIKRYNEIVDSYIDMINKPQNISIYMLNTDIINNFIYGSPIFELEGYISGLRNLPFDDVMNEIACFLSGEWILDCMSL